MVRYDDSGEENTDNVVDLLEEDNVVDLSDWYYGL